MSEAPLRFEQGDDAVEVWRADLYGLLARLWIAPPDSELMQRLQAAPPASDAGATLAAPWQGLLDVMKTTSVGSMSEEFDTLFQGVGKPDIFPYGSYYLSGFLNERPLVHLRKHLDELGLARDEARAETEDHVAFVCEVMRYLIAGEDAAVCNLESQRRFFRAQVQTWIEAFCDAVAAHPGASAYRAVAELTRAFVQVEAQGFDMLET